MFVNIKLLIFFLDDLVKISLEVTDTLFISTIMFVFYSWFLKHLVFMVFAILFSQC